MIVDRRFWPLMLDLRTCLSSALEKDGTVGCTVAAVPGLAFDAGAVTQGKAAAWVRLSLAFPSNSVDQESTLANCSPLHAAQFEIGIVRCYPALGRTEASHPVRVLEESAERQLADMALMVDALCCTGRKHVLGQYAPIGPEGLLYGGSWLVTFPQDF